jgi:hypothetical protein
MLRSWDGKICFLFVVLFAMGFITPLASRLGNPIHLIWIGCAILLTIALCIWISTTR